MADASASSVAGKYCLVTGGTGGIGRVTARELARRGARVVLVGRSEARCVAAVDAIRREASAADVTYLTGDLSSQRDVRRVAREYRERHPRLDVLVNNAGGLYLDRELSADGIEMTFALNHLGYYLLTMELLDLLRASGAARIVNVSSEAHRTAVLDFDDLQNARRYGGWRAYGQSKLANLYFTYELARRLAGTPLTVNALHPGLVATNFAKNNGVRARLMWIVLRIIAIGPEAGARTSVFLAASPTVDRVTGRYFVKEVPRESSAVSYDPDAARQLWTVSAEMVAGEG
jgi:retinol dehydrogenase 12